MGSQGVTEENAPSVTSKRNMAGVPRQAFLLHNPQPQALHPAGMSASILTLGQKCPETPGVNSEGEVGRGREY